MGDDNKIQMEVVLDTSKAMGDADKFAQATADKLRHNPAIDQLFGDTPANRSKDEFDKKEYIKRRAKLAEDEKWAAQYNSREGRSDVAAKRVMLRQQVTEGRRRLAEEKRERLDASAHWYRVDQERGRRRREQLKEELRIADENERRGNRIGRAASRALTTVAGTAAYGFHGTAEGNLFANEFKLMARELAGIFKPVIGVMTNITAITRRYLEGQSEGGQNALMYGAGALGIGALGAYFAPQWTGTLARGAMFDAQRLGGRALGGIRSITGGGAGGLMRGGVYGYLADTAFGGLRELSPWGRISGAANDPLTRGEAARFGYRAGMTPDERTRNSSKLLARMGQRMQEQNAESVEYIVPFTGRSGRSLPGKVWSQLMPDWAPDVFGTSKSGFYDDRARGVEINRMGRAVEADGFAEGRHREVKSADSVGYGALGSTAEMIQEKLASLGGSTTPGILEMIYALLLSRLPGGSSISDLLGSPDK